MKNFFCGITIFSVLFLLWECAETSDPVLPTPIQAKRLLAGDSSKSWRLSAILNQNYDATCSDLLDLNFLIAKDSILINNSETCIVSGDSLIRKYMITSDTAYVYLKFYRHKDPDTLRRKIIYITDKEFRAEYFNDSLKENVIARYLAL